MKKIIWSICLGVLFLVTGCKKRVSDGVIKTKISTILVDYPNAKISVREGKVTLSGVFDSQENKNKAIEAIKKIEGVELIAQDTSIISDKPVEIAQGLDAETQKKVEDILYDFPSIKMSIVDGVITLTGNIGPTQAKKIEQAIGELNIKNINYNYTIK